MKKRIVTAVITACLARYCQDLCAKLICRLRLNEVSRQ